MARKECRVSPPQRFAFSRSECRCLFSTCPFLTDRIKIATSRLLQPLCSEGQIAEGKTALQSLRDDWAQVNLNKIHQHIIVTYLYINLLLVNT